MNEEKNVVSGFLEKIDTTEIKVSNGRIFQTQRNQIHEEIDNVVYELLKASGFEVYPIKKGSIINVPHSELGAFSVVVSTTIPGLEVDALEEYELDKKLKETKDAEKQEKADKKARKIASDKLARAKAKALKQKIIAE